MYKWLLLLLVIPSFLFADKEQLKRDLKKFLDKYNSGSSVESPKLYKGQMAGYATAGSVSTRNRVFNRKPLTFTPPSYSAGCAGIDAHMGSFSYISREELVDAMKDIASNAASYAFLLTMKSVSPQSEDVMRWLQEQSNQMNAMNINSCELAEQAVSSVWPKMEGSRQHICRSMKSQSGGLASYARSRSECAYDEEMSVDGNSGDAMVDSYNLAWNVIKKDPFLATQPQFAELFMSITGTVIIDEKGVPTHYPSKVNDQNFMKSLFKGGTLECYLCSNEKRDSSFDLKQIFNQSNQCLEIREGEKDFSVTGSFYHEIKGRLENIQISLTNNTELEAADKEILMKTRLPIGRIICALTAYHRGRSPIEIATLAEIVTIDVVCQYLKDVVRNAKATAQQLKDVQMNDYVIVRFIDNLQDVEKVILEYESNSKRIFEERFQFMKMLQIIEDNLKKNIAL